MIVYRHFRNQDVPALVDLWNSCDLGSGAARRFSSDAFDQFVLAEPYFDRRALVEAWHDGQLVGYAHAGFGPDATGSRLCHDPGVVCMVLVRPQFRRQGIGRHLVELAEEFLKSQGASALQAGESLNRIDGLEQRVLQARLDAQTEQSEAEDLDLLAAISEFQNRQTGYDAALKSYSIVQRMSLFEYLR